MNFIERIVNSYREHRAYVNTRTQLEALSDKELRDIGIERHMIAEYSHLPPCQ